MATEEKDRAVINVIALAKTTRRLSVLRQQKFSNAPVLDMDEMGVIVMPFINGSSVMAKRLSNLWEFGYCRDRIQKVQSEPFITNTPHDVKLLQISEDIQNYLSFNCEIEYIISEDGEVFVVQAKDISDFKTFDGAPSIGRPTDSDHPVPPDQRKRETSIRLDGVRRIIRKHSAAEQESQHADAGRARHICGPYKKKAPPLRREECRRDYARNQLLPSNKAFS